MVLVDFCFYFCFVYDDVSYHSFIKMIGFSVFYPLSVDVFSSSYHCSICSLSSRYLYISTVSPIYRSEDSARELTHIQTLGFRWFSHWLTPDHNPWFSSCPQVKEKWAVLCNISESCSSAGQVQRNQNLRSQTRHDEAWCLDLLRHEASARCTVCDGHDSHFSLSGEL